ncbi:MAG: hypothetical protein VB081_00655 [Christensenella sp.]|uniref:hypothetical protein n=1 Tax=Christensenella sp. TaxID=1935934 RepID=UPI002B1F36FE|nr:hypothetical protein [Christensenella sp.]MEA5001999.1 hypothetical protein [Christensenella sp.]
MFEETSQTPEETATDFMDGWNDETPTEAAEEEIEEEDKEEQEGAADAEGETVEEETDKKEAIPAVFKVKHNGKELELSQDEVITNAQKGMDYDRIRAERDSLKNSREVQLINRLARQAGMPVHDYIEGLEGQLHSANVTARAASYIDGGMDEEAAYKLADAEIKKEQLENTIAAQNSERQTEAETNAKIQRNIEEFERLYPDVTEIPQEVIADIQATGKTPVQAYRDYQQAQREAELERKEKELAKREKTKENQETSPGSVKGTTDKPDPFLEGFNSEW